MNDNNKTKIKTKTNGIIAAATILVVVASVAMIGIQMPQYALAKHAARDPVTFDETLAHDLIGYSGKLPSEPNVAPGCQVNACG